MRFISHELGDIELLDFISLSEELKMKVLEMRNHPKVREQMHNYNIISKQDHFLFFEFLKENDKNKYFLVKNKEKFIGVIYFNSINLLDKKAVIGMYANLNEKTDGAGSVLMESILHFFHKTEQLIKLYLEVYESNYIAIRLYLKFGFFNYDSFFKENKKVFLMKLQK